MSDEPQTTPDSVLDAEDGVPDAPEVAADAVVATPAKSRRPVVAWLLVGAVLLAVYAYWAIANAPLVEGDFRLVRSAELTQVNFVRAPSDPTEVIRGFELISKDGKSEKVLYRPNDKRPINIRSRLERKPDQLRVEVWSGPMYRAYPLWIRVREGSGTRYEVFWLTPSPRGEVSPYALKPADVP